MKKYTILTYIFGGYDTIKEPAIKDPDAEYVMVTDTEQHSDTWNIVIDSDLNGKNPIYSSYYVRYHPFKYASTNIVIVLDASIKIKDSLSEIVADFLASGADAAIMLTSFSTDEQKIRNWKTYERISQDDVNVLHKFISKVNHKNEQGTIGQGFCIRLNNMINHRYLTHVWRYLLVLGKGIPVRLDEVIANKLLYKYNFNLFVLNTQIIQSTYMTYYGHNTSSIMDRIPSNDERAYLMNRPIYPHRYDKKWYCNRIYKYKTEALLLTKYLNEADLDEWLTWHLFHCKFDKIHVMDNESSYDVKRICDKFGRSVSYQLIEGPARQYRLYDAYINTFSNAEWILPLDDDEYLDIGKFATVYDAITYYHNIFPHLDMLAIRWKHLFPTKFHSERHGKVLDYCVKSNPELAEYFMEGGDGIIKTFVKRNGIVHYEETWENIAGGHVPKHSCAISALLCNGHPITACGIANCPDHLENEYIRILHCRYKGYSEYTRKMKEVVTVSDATPRKKHFKFDDILETLD